MSFWENWPLVKDSEATNGLKIEEEVFINIYFGPVHKIHSNPMMGTLSNSNFLSWNLAFSRRICRGKKSQKPKMLLLSGLGAK